MSKYSSSKNYEPIISSSKNWPVTQLSKHRKDFMHNIIASAYQEILESNQEELRRLLERTIYKEKARLTNTGWRIDKKQHEATFWKECERKLFSISKTKDEQAMCEALLKKIITHYVREMTGKFQRGHYHIVKRLVISLFTRLLNAVHVPFWGLLSGRKMHLADKIHVLGKKKQLRILAQKGIIVMVPTHFSHLDTILIGWVIHHLGLPPFLYGAGINLFNIGIFSYFMHRSGAYKIDRRKKNLIYLETLKIFKKGIIKYGCHSVFFPGGTRSRTGSIERSLKLGLLSTTVTAQREFYEESQEEKKIFLVPVVINYHFVLEAPALIREHLKSSGRDRYYNEQDEFSTSYKIFKFLFTFFSKGSNISLCVGQALDVLGNYVDENGESFSKTGQKIDTKDYFLASGKVTNNMQREHEYTRELSTRIIEEYHKNSQVLCSHMVAFVAFILIQRQHPRLDLYDLLRLPRQEISIPYETFLSSIRKLQQVLLRLEKMQRLCCETLVKEEASKIITQGIACCGMYHSRRPLGRRKNGDITTHNLDGLYYYHNRLTGYALEEAF